MLPLHLHSIGDASLVHASTAAALGSTGLAALLLPQICSVVMPDHPGDLGALRATMELHHELLDAA